MINIYCDESCHLENDNINIMVLGAIAVPEFAKKTVYQEIKKIKENMNISPFREIKWTKVSNSEIEYYKKLIDYIFENESLKFRAVLLPDKSKLNHKYYSRTHDDFYYIMYYYLLRKYMNTNETLKVYIDIKDTKSNEKVKKKKIKKRKIPRKRFSSSTPPSGCIQIKTHLVKIFCFCLSLRFVVYVKIEKFLHHNCCCYF